METQILRCEICGGELKYAADGKSAQCLNCGNEFWFKEEKSGAVALALNRAAEKRRRNDFDSAIDEYRLVIHENPQDAEAHWGLAISTYGIEYVEDYRTGKLVPTCRRAVPRESILDNANFKAALECAAPEQRAKYEEQAKEIDRLQKEIIKKIDEEEDYDVFISFKSTDDDRPTADRYIARRIYDELEKRGIKTFYSEETLKTRAFEDYEPIIFKALFSCKFFILVATDARYINSSWVKNEWSRFRDRVMEENLTGNCCAVFKNVRAGDLPAFIRKQGVDLAKYPAGGYEIELADNISVKLGKTKRQSEADEIRKQIEEQRRAFEESQKALEEKLAAAATAEKSEKTGASATVRSLLMRAGQEREDGNFDKAREYYGKVLDADPVNSDGWFGLFLCETKAKTQDKLGWKSDCAEGDFQEVIAQDDRLRSAFDGRNFRNAEKYADENRRKEIKSYCEAQTQLYSASRRAALDRYVSFGYDKLQSGQFAQAKELFKLALEKDNSLPLAWMGKALACAGAADLDGMALGGEIESEQDFHAVMEHLAAAESALTSVDYDNALGSAPQELRAQWAQKREELLAACASAKQNALAQLKALAQKYLAAENFSAKRVAQAYLQYVPDDVEAQWLAFFAEYSVKDDADLGKMNVTRLTMARDLQNSRIPALSASGEALALYNKRKEAIDAGAYDYAKDGLKNKNFDAVKAVCSAYERVSSAYTVRILWLGAFAYAQETDFNALLASVTPITYIAKIAENPYLSAISAQASGAEADNFAGKMAQINDKAEAANKEWRKRLLKVPPEQEQAELQKQKNILEKMRRIKKEGRDPLLGIFTIICLAVSVIFGFPAVLAGAFNSDIRWLMIIGLCVWTVTLILLAINAKAALQIRHAKKYEGPQQKKIFAAENSFQVDEAIKRLRSAVKEKKSYCGKSENTNIASADLRICKWCKRNGQNVAAGDEVVEVKDSRGITRTIIAEQSGKFYKSIGKKQTNVSAGEELFKIISAPAATEAVKKQRESSDGSVVYAKVSGVIKECLFSSGDLVRNGDPIFVVTDDTGNEHTVNAPFDGIITYYVQAGDGIGSYTDVCAINVDDSLAPPTTEKMRGDVVLSPAPGKVKKLCVAQGSVVRTGDVIVVLDAMHMETPVVAPKSGTIEYCVQVGDSKREGDYLCLIK